MEYSIIANSGIQLFTFPLEIDLKQNFKRWFHEWYDKEEGIHKLDLVECVHTDDGDTFYYNKKELIDKGYLTAFETRHQVNPDEVREDGLVHPLAANAEGDDYCWMKSFLCHSMIVKTNCPFMKISGFQYLISVVVYQHFSLISVHSTGLVLNLFQRMKRWQAILSCVACT